MHNPKIFMRYFRWSYTVRQCAVNKWLRRVHLSRRQRSRHPSSSVDCFQEEKRAKRDMQSVFFSRELNVHSSKWRKGSIRSGNFPNCAVKRYLENLNKILYIEAIWNSFREKDCSSFYHTRSNAVALFNTLLTMCVEKVNNMKTGVESTLQICQSTRLPRVVLTSNLHHGH